jgi:hypothetical protein
MYQIENPGYGIIDQLLINCLVEYNMYSQPIDPSNNMNQLLSPMQSQELVPIYNSCQE